MKPLDVVGVGTAVVDYLGVVPSYPAPDSQMQLEQFTKQGGGNVATALVALARLGVRCGYLGKLGDDELGRLVWHGLATEGVDMGGSMVRPGGSAGFAFIIVERGSGRRTILWTEQGKEKLGKEELDRERLRTCRYLHLDQYDMELAIAAADIARDAGVSVVLDAESWCDGMDRLLPLVDVLIASREFAVDCGGGDDLSRDADDLRRRFGSAIAVVTAGERGCHCATPDNVLHQAAFAIDAVDTTGCGDVFHGAFIYGLLQNWTVPRTARFASAAAALQCRELGGRTAVPRLPEVERLLAESPD